MLTAYLDRVPRDVETGNRVCSNPLMLSMIISIFELRQGLEMPATVARMYEIASQAMLERNGDVSSVPHLNALLLATFFEAHVNQQRVLGERQPASPNPNPNQQHVLGERRPSPRSTQASGSSSRRRLLSLSLTPTLSQVSGSLSRRRLLCAHPMCWPSYASARGALRRSAASRARSLSASSSRSSRASTRGSGAC